MKTPRNLMVIMIAALLTLFFASSCAYRVHDHGNHCGHRHEYVYKPGKPKKVKRPKKHKHHKHHDRHDDRPGGHHRH